ncbi:energy transducer TonB [Winogradskyella sp. A2]|uniref:energy transducer TonB n=1 Tax=Winogradskyella sp. A2 TaxID=3366944 RepID=UPI00398C4DD3
MLYNIIQIVAFQALFLLVYDWFLRKETFFNYNRAYLLITSILSLVLPFIKFSSLKALTTKDMVIQLPEVFIGTKIPTQIDIQIAEQAGIIIEQPSTPLWQIILSVGCVIALSIFLFKIIKLYWMRHQNPKRWRGNVLIVKLIKSSAAFSFFNTIFLGERIPEEEQPTIYKHELVHIKEWHSLDLLYFEVMRIVLWFNPLVYMYQNRIKELHEYIADAKAIKQNGKSSYYQTLLNQVFDVNNVSFTNTFFKKSLIKKRIAMLQKSRSKQMNLLKYALLIPLVLGMLIYTSTEVKAQEKVGAQEETISQELTEEQLIKKYYEEIIVMEKKGAAFIEIANYAGMSKNSSSKYVISKEQFLKSKAYKKYLAEKMIERKSQDGTLADSDLDLAENMKLRSTYVQHREWLKTQEAKEHWESYARDGELRLVVDDLANKTVMEQKRFDALLKQLTDDEIFNKLIVCEVKGASGVVLYAEDVAKSDMQIPIVDESVEVPFSVIEEVPTTIDCKELATNEERKQCMSQFVAKHVNKNFNIGLADSLGITGRQRIFVSFKIDKEGYVTSAKARASHPALETEAVRVIKTLPQFSPGKQKGKAVIVPYALPIMFQIAGGETDSKSPKNEKLVDSLGGETYIALKELTEQRDKILQNSSDKNPVVIQLNSKIDSLRKEMLKLFEVYMEQRSKMTELTTTVLINRNDEFLINDKKGDLEYLDELLQSISADKKHLVRIVYDKEASQSAIDGVVNLTKKYPYVILQQEVGGPLSKDNKKHDLLEVPFSVVDVSPTHPDCKSIDGNEERKKCTSAKVSMFVNSNFNTKLASTLDLPDGRQEIFGAFTIDKQGFVKNVEVRAPHPKLEEETARVLNLLPQFVPGMHKGENIDVSFSLPIVFQLAKDKKKKN